MGDREWTARFLESRSEMRLLGLEENGAYGYTAVGDEAAVITEELAFVVTVEHLLRDAFCIEIRA